MDTSKQKQNNTTEAVGRPSPIFHTAYTPRRKTTFKTRGPSKTKQHFKNDCDINVIIKKHRDQGILPQMIRQNPIYGDFSSVPTFQNALNTVIKAQQQFEALPANIRERFHNDPEKFLEFATNASNAEEMVRLGLAIKRPSEAILSEKKGTRKGASASESAPGDQPPT